ncbi:MAG: D-glycerate dehydrogenase [Alphaproteobacteria bacterium]|nr:MAG: D-glycerate dehydrogenase [Alphaproteobacteria bacterium]
MKKVFVARKLLESNEKRMSEIWDAKLNSEDKVYSQSELIELSRDCDGILCSIVDKFDVETINKLSDKVKIISNFAVGFGNIDIKAAMNKNIIVTNTPDVLTDATAEIAILILLGAARRATEGRKWVDKKNWNWSVDFLMGKQLTDSRLGILGMGRIGQALAERTKSFGMKIHYHNRKKLPSNLEKGAIYHESLKSLISVSDFFSINCPTTEETKKIINEETLSYFLNGAVIINSARGDMIDDEAMINVLKSGKVFALGLDVYNGEPDIHPQYLKLDNVFILPHLGSATEKTRFAMADLAISNIEEYFKTGKCKNTVN